MQYNILNGAVWEINTTVGNKFIDFNDVYLLNGCGSTPIVYLSGNDKFVMDFDFGHRIHLDRFEYKFISNITDYTTVASGISFFYKNESFDDYELMDTFFSYNDIFYTTMSGSIFAPRYIRLNHTISGTHGYNTISGSVYGFSALNNDSIVGFGVDGNKATEFVETARGSESTIRSVAIYNSGLTIADAFINLEPEFSPVDEVMYISGNSNGPWIKSLNTSDLIADSTNFNYGYTTGLQTINDPLRMNGVNDLNNNFATMFKDDYYISRVFEKNNTYCRFVMNNKGIGGYVSIDKYDVIETIEVRSSNTPPIPYTVIRELRNSTISSTSKLGYRDRWLCTQIVKEESSWYFLSCSEYSPWIDYKVVYDQITERWAGYALHHSTHYWSLSELYLFNNVGITDSKNYLLAVQSTNSESISYSFKELKLDFTGGMWVYLYCKSYHSGDFIHSTGYFLAYFDANMVNTFKLYTMTEEIGKMDISYNSKYIWYTNPDSKVIYKVNVTGDIIINFIDEDVTYKLGGIAVMPDESLIYANGKDLHRLKANGIYLPEYFIEGIAEDNIDYITIDEDGSEAIWTIEGMTIGRLYIYGEKKGTYDFRVTVDFPVKMISVIGGVWVHCADINGQGGIVMRFISKENRRVENEFRPDYNSSPGLIYQHYSHPNYTKKMPISIDSTWSNLSWNKVAINGFLTTEDQYHQLRMVLRCQTPIERYPEFVTNIDQEFISYDNFDQNESIPNRLLWSDWLNYPSLNRVYVNTIEKKLVLAQEISNPLNSYIDTKNRLMVSRDADGILDIRFRYTLGAGNNVNSSKLENLYLYACSLDPGYDGKYLGVNLYIPLNPVSSNCYVNSGFSDNWTSGTAWRGLNMYDGELRLYWDNTKVYGQRRNLDEAFVGSEYSVNSNSVGDHFYIKIFSSKDSSEVKIDNFNIYKGYTYYYTEGPSIESIYKQELLEIKAIYPNNYKDIYIKTYVPKDLEIGSNYDMDMKVRWRVPTY